VAPTADAPRTALARVAAVRGWPVVARVADALDRRRAAAVPELLAQEPARVAALTAALPAAATDAAAARQIDADASALLGRLRAVGGPGAWLDARVHAVEHYAAVGDDARIALAAACRSTNPAPCGALAALFVANGDRDGALRVARHACDADLAWACVRLGYVLDPELGGGDTGW